LIFLTWEAYSYLGNDIPDWGAYSELWEAYSGLGEAYSRLAEAYSGDCPKTV